MMFVNPKYKNTFFIPDDVSVDYGPDSGELNDTRCFKAKVKSKTLYEALAKYVEAETGCKPSETNIVHLIDMLLPDNIETIEGELGLR